MKSKPKLVTLWCNVWPSYYGGWIVSAYQSRAEALKARASPHNDFMAIAAPLQFQIGKNCKAIVTVGQGIRKGKK